MIMRSLIIIVSLFGMTACQSAPGDSTSTVDGVRRTIIQTVGQTQQCPTSVVHIRRTVDGGQYAGTGILLEDSRVLTAAHVIDDGDGELQVIFGGRNGHPEFDGADGQRVQAEIFPGPRDLAVLSNLQIPDWAQGVQIGDTSPRNGEILTSVGLEQPGAVRVRSAEVVGSHSRQPLIFLGVQAQQGNSGGPVFNEGGELIGLNSAVGVHIDHNIEVTEDPRGQTITIITRQVPATWVIDLPRIRSDFD